MKSFHFTATATVYGPDDAELYEAANGEVVGLKLKDGSLVKPWIVLEHQSDNNADGHDLDESQMEAVGLVGFEHGDREVTEETVPDVV